MGFRYEDLKLVYNPSYLNEIVRRVFELPLRKWSAIFYTFKADIVLLSGRPWQRSARRCAASCRWLPTTSYPWPTTAWAHGIPEAPT